MADGPRLPNLLIVGAAKAGTTSLHDFLRGHPDAFMSEPKEPRFFSYNGERQDEFAGPGADRLINSVIKTQAAYEALFEGANGARIVGESSPAYLYSPVAARRIRETVPDTKIVVVLRDPADRAYSHWVDNVSDGWEPVHDFPRVLDLAEERRRENWWRKWDYLGHGFYAEQLKRYLELFPGDQLKVFLFEDLFLGQDRSLNALLEFLELEPPPSAHRQLPRSNAGGLPRFRTVTSLVSGQNIVRSTMRRALPAQLRARIRGELLARNTVRPPLDPGSRERLQHLYRDDIRELESLIDRDLSAWLQRKPAT